MKTAWIAALVTGLALTLSTPIADAKRLGGGKSTGMQRSMPDKPAQQSTPAQGANPSAAPNSPAAPAAAAAPNAGAAAAAAAPKRSWLGPVAGLAAGLGLAALFSHLGMGEAFADIMMIVLLAIVAVMVLRFVMRRMAGGAAPARSPYAMAGAGAGSGQPASAPMARQALPASTATPGAALAGASAVTSTSSLPAGFDAAAFERIAKMIFIRLQAANDAGDLNDLRAFTTPEMFASAKLDLQDRGGVANKTDVVTVNAELLDFAQESDRQVVSVRYSGLIREEADGVAHEFDEVWHLVRPTDGSRDWAIAGIQQRV